MNSVLELDPHWVLIVGAIVVALLLLRLLLRVLNAGLGTILALVGVVLMLQYGFGISPKQLWLEIGQLPQELVQLVKSFS